MDAAPAVVPLPASTAIGPGDALALTEHTLIAGDAVAAAVLRSLVRARTGLDLETVGPDGDRTALQTPSTTLFDLGIERDGPAESYRLEAAGGVIRVTGADAAGLFYGVQTLAQLIVRDDEGFGIRPVVVEDAPRFAYRGVMLDVARHFFPVDTVKAYVDRASGLKLNVLHLHLTDDQGWRIQLRSRPKLTELASATAVAGDPGGFYTREDYRAIVAYAAARHMVVVPEVDTPGHTHAVGLAYPELVEDPVITSEVARLIDEAGEDGPRSETPYEGIAVGFSSLRIGSQATYDFLADVFGELAGLTPGPYLHVGGDECLGTDPAAFTEFVERVTEIVSDLGKIPIVWHEAGSARLSDDVIGQYWGLTSPRPEDEIARTFARSGSQLIMSPADAVYLDMKYDESTALGMRWADGPTSVERAYSWEPTAILEGVGEDDILGVEAPLWTETVRTLDDIDHLAFPRIAAAAEAAWSPASGEQRTWESFRERVGALGPLWASLGIRFFPSREVPWAPR